MAKAFPNIGISIHPSHLSRLIEWHAGRSADSVGEGFVVPECRVLKYEPSTRLADTTPPLTFVAMPTHPARSVKIALKAEFLFVWLHVGVLRVHVLFRRWDLFFVEASVEVWALRILGIMVTVMFRVRGYDEWASNQLSYVMTLVIWPRKVAHCPGKSVRVRALGRQILRLR
jgi:hypothetical protein